MYFFAGAEGPPSAVRRAQSVRAGPPGEPGGRPVAAGNAQVRLREADHHRGGPEAQFPGGWAHAIPLGRLLIISALHARHFD
jgi:hypothetical protein